MNLMWKHCVEFCVESVLAGSDHQFTRRPLIHFKRILFLYKKQQQNDKKQRQIIKQNKKMEKKKTFKFWVFIDMKNCDRIKWDQFKYQLVLSVQTEGRTEELQNIQVQVRTTECEKNTETREADQNPKNLTAEMQRHQTVEQHKHQPFLQGPSSYCCVQIHKCQTT